jgi:hypothetical protein
VVVVVVVVVVMMGGVRFRRGSHNKCWCVYCRVHRRRSSS